MKKLIFTGAALFLVGSIFANTELDRRKRGCRQWSVSLFNWTKLVYNSDECQNPDGNWDWGGNGTNP